MIKKIIFIAIIAVGILLRVYQTATYPQGLFLDELNIAVDAKSLAQNGVDQYGRHFPFGFEDATDYKLPGYIYLTAVAVKALGSQLIAIRIPAISASILSIFLLGYLAYLLFASKRIAFFTMIVIATSPLAIHFGRIGYETMVATCFLIVYLISFLKILYKQKVILFSLLGIVAIFVCNWTYPAPRFIIPVFTVGILILELLLRFEKVEKKFFVKTASIFLLATIVTFIPSFISPYLDKRPLSYLEQDTQGSFLIAVGSKFSSIISSVLRGFNLEFLFDKGDLFAYRHGTKEQGVFLQVFSVPYIIGLILLVKNFSKKNFPLIFTLLLLLVCSLPSALTSGVPYATRFLPMIIPLSLVIGLGFEQLYCFVLERKRYTRFILSSLFIGIISYQLGLFAHIYFTHFIQTGQPEFPHAPVEMAEFVKQEQLQFPEKPIYFLNNKSCRTWTNDTLYLWYFADLPNNPMIAWNNLFREQRYNNGKMSPFDAYDGISIPTYHFANLTLFPGENYTGTGAPKGSLFIRCGYHSIDPQKETLLKTLYMYEDQSRDPSYIISEKK